MGLSRFQACKLQSSVSFEQEMFRRLLVSFNAYLWR